MVPGCRVQVGFQGAPVRIEEGLVVTKLTALILDVPQQEYGIRIQCLGQTGNAVSTARGHQWRVLPTGEVANGHHRDGRRSVGR
jgi:hypothetical protein